MKIICLMLFMVNIIFSDDYVTLPNVMNNYSNYGTAYTTTERMFDTNEDYKQWHRINLWNDSNGRMQIIDYNTANFKKLSTNEPKTTFLKNFWEAFIYIPKGLLTMIFDKECIGVFLGFVSFFAITILIAFIIIRRFGGLKNEM